MNINIHMSGEGAEQELRSLHEWLQDEPDVRRCAKVSLLPNQSRPGEMGSALEVIQLVTDSGFQVANLALAYLTWRGTRGKKPKVTIERGNTKITIADSDPVTLERIVGALEPKKP